MDISDIFPTNSILDINIPDNYACRIVYDEDRVDEIKYIFNKIYRNYKTINFNYVEKACIPFVNFEMKFDESNIVRIILFEGAYLYCQPIENLYIFIFKSEHKAIFKDIEQSEYVEALRQEIEYISNRGESPHHAETLERLLHRALEL
jgi:hypothetical protein